MTHASREAGRPGTPHVLLVGGRDHTLAKLAGLGVRYSMVQIQTLASDRQASGAVRYAVADYTDLDTLLPLVRKWHAADPIDAVLSFTEYGLEPASVAAADLGVAGDNRSAVLATRDKTRTRALLDAHGLSPVRHRLCASMDEAREFIAEVGPVVLKPHDGGLSEGVYLVGSARQLTERWAGTKAVTDGPVLAEEYLTGPEYSVESISHGGVHEIAMVTEKVTTPPPRFVELGHQVPARITPTDRAAIHALVIEFLTLIGQTTGPTHTELRLTPNGPRLIESQTRFGGDQVWELCELVSGVDLMTETIASLTGLPLPSRTPAAPAAAIRFYGYENVRVLEVSGLEKAQAAPGVRRLACGLRPGQELGVLVSSDSRQGYVLCVGATVEEAVGNAEHARDLVQVRSEPWPRR